MSSPPLVAAQTFNSATDADNQGIFAIADPSGVFAPAQLPGYDDQLAIERARALSPSAATGSPGRRSHVRTAVELALAASVIRALTRSSRSIAQDSVNHTMPGTRFSNNPSILERLPGTPGIYLAAGNIIRTAVIAQTVDELTPVLGGFLAASAGFGANQALKHALRRSNWARLLSPAEKKELSNSTLLVSSIWARHYAANLAAGLGTGSADGLLVSLSTVERLGIAESLAWRLVHNAAGLPPGQTTSVMQVAQNRFNLARRSNLPISANTLARDIAKLYLSRRTRLILENEDQVARNFGTQLLLMNAVRKGFIPADTRKVWVTAVDERVCPVCAPMDSVAIGLGEKFRLHAHRGLLRHDIDLWVPPAHPNCRCRVVPESAIAHGIITRTARWSADANRRARLQSRMEDLVDQPRMDWMDEQS